MVPYKPEDDRQRQTKSGRIWRFVWRGLRFSRTITVIIVFTLSLAGNAALFVGGVLYNIIDETLERVTGLATETGKQRKQTDDLKRKNRQLVERNQNLQKRLTRTGKLVKRTATRSAKAAVRVMATAPGKAIPYAGTAVIVSATALEIKDLCNTFQDMKTIQREIDPSGSQSEDGPGICGIDTPTKQEILKQIKTVPRTAWQRSHAFLADLGSIPPMYMTWLDRLWKDMHPFRKGMHKLEQIILGPEELDRE